MKKYKNQRKIKVFCSICRKLRIVYSFYKELILEVKKQKIEGKFICGDCL